MKQINWGIIGAGDVCERKSGPAFNKIPHSKLMAIMRRSGNLAQDFAKRHQVPKWYDRAGDLINDPEINAIYIATPPNAHLQYTELAAKAGKPVYVEKPMALNYEECNQMIEVCQRSNVPLFVAYYRRSLPNFIQIKNWLGINLIGDIRYVDIQIQKPIKPDMISVGQNLLNWRTNPAIAGGGYFHDLGCHQLDILDYFFGPIESASGISKNTAGVYPADDTVIGHFKFESGIIGQGTWCFSMNDNIAKELTTIYGSKGTIAFSYFGDFSVTVHLEGQESKRFTFDIPENIQLPHIASIVAELRGEGTCPSDGASGARTAKVMDWITRK